MINQSDPRDAQHILWVSQRSALLEAYFVVFTNIFQQRQVEITVLRKTESKEKKTLWYLLRIGKKNDKNVQGFTKHLGPREKINLNHY